MPASEPSAQSTARLDPEYPVEQYVAQEADLLAAAAAGLRNALHCDAHVEEVFEAWKWAERVETSALALKNKLDALRAAGETP